jgi:hypothetical protein
VHTRTYQRIMPPYLPRRRELVYASGIAETVGGVGLLPQATRRLAGWWADRDADPRSSSPTSTWRCTPSAPGSSSDFRDGVDAAAVPMPAK